MRNEWIICKKDFLTNMKSVRMLIIVIVFTSIVIGASYGISIGTQSGTQPRNIVYPHVVELDNDGYKDDLALYYCDGWGNPLEDKEIKLLDIYGKNIPVDDKKDNPTMVSTTDKYGRAVFKNISRFLYLEENEFGSNYHMYSNIVFRVENQDKIGQARGKTQISRMQSVNNLNKTEVNDYFSRYGNILWEYRDIDRRRVRNHVLYHAINPEGDPSSDTVLSINDTKVAESDKFGYIDYEFSKGSHNVTIKNKYSESNFTSREFEAEHEFPYQGGPDNILKRLTGFITLILPVVCIALAYDSVAKERETNSLFFLLVKPIKKWKIGLGKLTGIFSAIAIPVIAVNSGSMILIWHLTGKPPSFNLILTFFMGSLALLAIFLSLQMIISTLSSSSGTAVLGGIGLWMYFNLFYHLIQRGITLLLGYPYGSYSYQRFSNYFLLFNPNMMFIEIMEIVNQGTLGLNLLTGIPDTSLFVSIVIWVIATILLLLIIFEKKLSKE